MKFAYQATGLVCGLLMLFFFSTAYAYNKMEHIAFNAEAFSIVVRLSDLAEEIRRSSRVRDTWLVGRNIDIRDVGIVGPIVDRALVPTSQIENISILYSSDSKVSFALDLLVRGESFACYTGGAISGKEAALRIHPAYFDFQRRARVRTVIRISMGVLFLGITLYCDRKVRRLKQSPLASAPRAG